jgi:fumarate reductase subunit D
VIRPSLREVIEALYGSWRLARLDAKGIEHFGTDAEAAIKSFFVAVILAPAYVLLKAITLPYDLITADAASVVAISALAYVIHWTALPVVMYPICDGIDRSRHYFRFVAAFNWITVLQLALVLPVTLLLSSDLVPSGIVGILYLAMYVAVLGYIWFTVGKALEITGLGAAGVVFLDFAITELIENFAVRAIT